MIKVLPLRGFKSLKALNAFHALLLGLKMLPAYQGEQYETFFERVDAMPDSDKQKIIREAAFFVDLQPEELEAMVSFCEDANGVPYSRENIKSLGPAQLIEIIVAVSMELSRMKITLVSETEKKN